LFSDEDVLRLQVAVDYTQVMGGRETRESSTQYSERLLSSQLLSGTDNLPKLRALHVLHDEKGAILEL
jgi:hypothetical protein